MSKSGIYEVKTSETWHVRRLKHQNGFETFTRLGNSQPLWGRMPLGRSNKDRYDGTPGLFELLRTRFRLTRCLIVGLPWGQDQGLSMSAMWSTICRMPDLLRAVPIITEDRQARDANINRTRDGRSSRDFPAGSSLSMKINSSTSCGKIITDMFKNWFLPKC